MGYNFTSKTSNICLLACDKQLIQENILRFCVEIFQTFQWILKDIIDITVFILGTEYWFQFH